MKTAIIDLGTNTFNLLIRDGDFGEILLNTKIAVKLGEGGINDNTIAPAPFQRGLDALTEHMKTIAEFEVDHTYAFATSAIRSATNGSTFVEEASKQCGVKVNVIDGQKEAELIYHGVKNALTLDSEPSLIMDIGGGSTEYILANDKGVLWMQSFDLGASRLLERFKPSDPIDAEEILNLEDYLDKQLVPLWKACKTHSPKTLIGSSGSFDTLAAMVQAAFPDANYDPEKTTYTFNIDQYHSIAHRMISFNLEERLTTDGMIPMRADMIVMACIQINYVLNKLNLQQLKLSTYALKEGVFFTLNNTDNTWQKS